MLTRHCYIITLFSLLAIPEFAKGLGEENGSKTAEVELLIVCDVECFERFQWDRQKLIDYWYVYMWDVNMRFKTLPSVDISFRVTSILTINKTEDQPFVENARLEDGAIALKSVWKAFRKWVYTQEKELPGFDVALLVTAAKQATSDGHMAYEQFKNGRTACLKDDTAKKHLSTIALHATATWGYHCASLEAALAEIIGAKYDMYTDCKQINYLMSNSDCNIYQYTFSKCSDAAISRFVKSPQAACLHTSEAPERDVLKEAAVTHGPSFNDQCVMITGNNKAVALSAEKEQRVDPCVISKCSVFENGNWTFLKWLLPVDNSLCGDGNVCFRGRCLAQGVQLQNIETGMCLQPNKKFGKMEFPSMVTCRENPTPLDQVRIVNEKEDYFGKFLATPTTIPSLDSSNQDACLSNYFDYQNISQLEYTPCLNADEVHVGWDLVNLNQRYTEFMLSHRFTNSCLKVGNDRLVRIQKDCYLDDRSAQWTLVKPPLIPLNLIGSTTLELVDINSREPKKASKRADILWIAIQVFMYLFIFIGCIIVLLALRRYTKDKRSARLAQYEAVEIKL